jgi:hypothetical protein
MSRSITKRLTTITFLLLAILTIFFLERSVGVDAILQASGIFDENVEWILDDDDLIVSSGKVNIDIGRTQTRPENIKIWKLKHVPFPIIVQTDDGYQWIYPDPNASKNR